MKDQV